MLTRAGRIRAGRCISCTRSQLTIWKGVSPNEPAGPKIPQGLTERRLESISEPQVSQLGTILRASSKSYFCIRIHTRYQELDELFQSTTCSSLTVCPPRLSALYHPECLGGFHIVVTVTAVTLPNTPNGHFPLALPRDAKRSSSSAPCRFNNMKANKVQNGIAVFLGVSAYRVRLAQLLTSRRQKTASRICAPADFSWSSAAKAL